MKTNTRKVFCSNCKHLANYQEVGGSLSCKFSRNFKKEEFHETYYCFEKNLYSITDEPSELNKYNNCGWYEEKK